MEASPSNALKIISLLDSVRKPEADKMLTPHTPASFVGAAACCKLDESGGEEGDGSVGELKTQLEDLEYLKVGFELLICTGEPSVPYELGRLHRLYAVEHSV